jgi:hypothetical protein
VRGIAGDPHESLKTFRMKTNSPGSNSFKRSWNGVLIRWSGLLLLACLVPLLWALLTFLWAPVGRKLVA